MADRRSLRGSLAALVLSLGLGGSCAAQGQTPPPPAPGAPVAPVQGMAPAGTDQPEGQLPTRTIEAAPGAPQVVVAPILTVDQEELFSASAWGQRTQSALEDEGRKISAENEKLAAQLSEEEAQLTRRRASLDPGEFRKLAEAFDARATRVRRERAQAVQALNDWAEADRNAFYRAALPLMGEMMQDRRAVAVLDRRTVFVSLDAIDITADLVKRLDTDLGDGAGAVPFPAAQEKGGGTAEAGPDMGEPVAEPEPQGVPAANAPDQAPAD